MLGGTFLIDRLIVCVVVEFVGGCVLWGIKRVLLAGRDKDWYLFETMILIFKIVVEGLKHALWCLRYLGGKWVCMFKLDTKVKTGSLTRD